MQGGGNFFIYSDQGWMPLGGEFKTYFGRGNERGPSLSDADLADEDKNNNWINFINCVKSRKVEDLDCDVAEGHLPTVLGHLGVVSYRTGRKLNLTRKLKHSAMTRKQILTSQESIANLI